MRLIDRHLERPIWQNVPQATGLAALARPAVAGPHSASVRYVLDLPASQACGELIREGEGLFEPENPLFRLPAEALWLELYVEPGTERDGANRRLGYLVISAPDGRSGAIHPFVESGSGSARPLPCTIEFDLDRRLDRMIPSPQLRSFQHGAIEHLADLLHHSRLRIDSAWLSQNTAREQYLVPELAEGTWFALPLLFAFAALLNSPQVIDFRPSDLARLNRARAERGRPPLLDHVEVRLSLGSAGQARGVAHGGRAMPRLHFVRGHFVQRSGKTFWRQAHLRGDTSHAIVSRTVNVTAAKALRQGSSATHVREAVRATSSR